MFSYAGNTNSSPYPAPWLYRSYSDVDARIHASDVFAQIAVGWGGKIVAIGNAGDAWLFDGTAWSQVNASITGTSDIPISMFVTSKGTVLASFTSGGGIWRSTDLGTTWTKVHQFNASDGGVTSYFGPMCEASNGYLFCGQYAPPGPTSVLSLLRSEDDGATWVDITANLAHQPQRHIHGCWWDTHRNLLFIADGDGGLTEYIQISDDFGTSFTDWTNTRQAVGMSFTSKHILFTADVSDDRRLYRAVVSGTSIADVVAAVPEVVFDPTTLPGMSTQVNAGIGWWHHVNEFGQIVAIYGKSPTDPAWIISSPDEGATWYSLATDPSEVAYNFAMPSQFLTDWDGYFYHVDSQDSGCFKWRVYPAATTFKIDPVNGIDWTADGVNTPWKTIPDHALDAAVRVQLQADYQDVFFPGATGLAVDKNGHAFTAPTPAAPGVFETFEGTPVTTTKLAGTGTVDQASTVNPYAGTKCARCQTTGTPLSNAYVEDANFFSAVVSGDEGWLSGYFNVAAAPGNVSTLLYIVNSASVAIDPTYNQLMVVTPLQNNTFFRQSDVYGTPFPYAKYVYIKMRCRFHATAGEIQVWQDGKEVLLVTGIPTLSASPTPLHALWGLSINFAGTTTVDVDNVSAAINGDPDQPVSPTLNGTRQALLPDGIYS